MRFVLAALPLLAACRSSLLVLDGGAADQAAGRDLLVPDLSPACQSTCVQPADCPGRVCCIGFSNDIVITGCTDSCPIAHGIDTAEYPACDTDQDCLAYQADLGSPPRCCEIPHPGICGSYCRPGPCPPRPP